MFSKLIRLWSNARAQRRQQRPRGARLFCQRLDDRCVPAILWWNGDDNDNWSDKTNWWDPSLNNGNGGEATAAPSANDTVKFGSLVETGSELHKNTDSNLDRGNFGLNWTIAAMTVTSGYTKTITIGLDNGAAGTLEVTGVLTFDGGTNATIVGVMALGERPDIEVDGGLDWKAGTFEKVEANIAINSTSTISTTGTKSLKGTKLTNSGTMTWTAGDVATAASGGNNGELYNGGTFEMKAEATLGTANLGKLTNAGTLKKLTSVTSTVAIDFLNRGYFYVSAGVAKFTGAADQGILGTQEFPPPLTRMDGGDLESTTWAYQVFDGDFEGVGTITGTLYMYGGELWVGLNEGPGTLTVTGNYSEDHATQDGKLHIYINSGGTSSLLAVEGDVDLAGDLYVHNTPYEGLSNMTFMTYDSVSGIFASWSFDMDTWETDQGTRRFVPTKNSTSYVLVNQDAA